MSTAGNDGKNNFITAFKDTKKKILWLHTNNVSVPQGTYEALAAFVDFGIVAMLYGGGKGSCLTTKRLGFDSQFFCVQLHVLHVLKNENSILDVRYSEEEEEQQAVRQQSDQGDLSGPSEMSAV